MRQPGLGSLEWLKMDKEAKTKPAKGEKKEKVAEKAKKKEK